MRARRSPEPPFPPTAWRSLGMAARQIAEIFLLLARFLLPTQASEGRPSRLKAVPKGERSLTSKSVRMSRVRLRPLLRAARDWWFLGAGSSPRQRDQTAAR